MGNSEERRQVVIARAEKVSETLRSAGWKEVILPEFIEKPIEQALVSLRHCSAEEVAALQARINTLEELKSRIETLIRLGSVAKKRVTAEDAEEYGGGF